MAQRDSKPQHRGCNNSVALFELAPPTDGLRHAFEFVSTVVDYTQSPGEEGASEHAIVVLADERTLLAVVRIAGGDGRPHGRHRPARNRPRAWRRTSRR